MVTSITPIKDTIEKRRTISKEEQQRLYKKIGIFQPLKPVKYREAIMIIPPKGLVAMDDPAWLKIHELAKKDHLFYESIQEDPALHEVFTSAVKLYHTWKPTTPTEDIMLETIFQAIEDRLEYVLAQKVMLGKYFHLLSDEDKTRFHELADAEIMETERVLQSRLQPNFKELQFKLHAIFSLDFLKKDHEPNNPTRQYKFDFPLC